jgi:TetR/AcrR family transcriptional regulator
MIQLILQHTMPDDLTAPLEADPEETLPASLVGATSARKRPKPGERRIQILQALAAMLEQPAGERITTAALAARLQVSEAALYRHFASKAQMFEGLIEFIEQSVFTLANQIVEREQGDDPGIGARQSARIIAMLVHFAEKNPGMSRVMVGDALVFENERLQQRMNQFFDKIEATLKQCLRNGSLSPTPTPTADAQVRAAVLTAFAVGRLQRFVRSGFRRLPSENLETSLAVILG